MTVTDTTDTKTNNAGNNASPSANEVNPHYLDHVMNVSDTHGVEASEDIVAKNGMKLLAKGARIDASVRERLLEHKLIKPLEQCMQVADGVTAAQLQDAALALMEDAPLLRPMCQPAAVRQHVLATVKALPLNAPLQSLLTVYHGSGPDKLRHAVSVALMSLAMAQKLPGAARSRVTPLQMLQAGLCHDVGELYIEPSFLKAGHRLDASQWKHVAAHPIVGWRVIKSLPGAGPAVADLVMDHHERLDGFGYPRGRAAADLPIDSQILALSELLAGLMESTSPAPLMQADVAVKLIPGEFHRQLIDLVDQAVHQPQATSAPVALDRLPPFENLVRKAENTVSDLRRVGEARQALEDELTQASAPFQALLEQARVRMETIHKALSSTGLDAQEPEELRRRLLQLAERPPQDIQLEVGLILREIGWRLRELEREVTSRAERVAPGDLPRLFKLLAVLKASADPAASPPGTPAAP